MKINRIVFSVATALTLNLAVSAQTNLLMVGDPPGTTRSDDYQWGAGFGFYAPSGTGTTINALGFWDQGGDGLSANHVVALYQYSGSGSSYNLLTDVTVQSGTVDSLIGGYRWVDIPTLSLPDNGQGGNYYIVFATQGGGDAWTDLSGQTLNPVIGTFGGNALISSANTDGYDLSQSVPGFLANYDSVSGAYGGANLAFIQPVPEPATCALLGGGLIMLLRLRRKN
jgi:hypothetical protein